MEKRNQLVDMLKGYACFLVVFGHVIMGIRKAGIVSNGALVLENFIWTFHVALFMFLSGYVYHLSGDWKNKNSVKKFIGYKLLNLGIPYLIFSIIYILINGVMSSAVNNEFKTEDILFLWKTPVAQYWFLYALFWLFVIFSILGQWLRNWGITVIIFLINILLGILQLNVGILDSALSMGFIFGLGASIDSISLLSKRWYVKVACVIFHIIAVLIILPTYLDKIWIGSQIEACIGIVGSIAFIDILSNVEIIKKILLWICKYSFPIYLLHTIFTAGIRIALFKSGIDNYWIHIVSGVVLGIGIPYIGACITRKLKALDFFFYPSRTIKSLKKNG